VDHRNPSATEGAEVPTLEPLSGWCAAYLGSEAERTIFTSKRLGTVVGVALADGRRVVIKLHAPDGSARQVTVQRVQAHLHRSGFPCPRPLLGPTRFGSQVAVVEELVDAGDAPNAHDPVVRKAMARGLATQIRLTRDLEGSARALAKLPSWIDLSSGGTWPRPHHPKLDFLAVQPEVDWVDEIAAKAKEIFLSSDAGPTVIAHSDWEAHNVRCSDGRLVAVYDWDSLAIGSEPLFVGRAAAVFTAHTDPRFGTAPSADERRGFVGEFEEARGEGFTRTEMEAIDAVSVWATAYESRLALAFSPERAEDPGSFVEALRQIALEGPFGPGPVAGWLASSP
jgi:Phosphotransferase enzyme family